MSYYHICAHPWAVYSALCNLVGAAIGGAVLLGAIHLVGFWAIPWGVGTLVAMGVYKLLVQGL